MSKIEWFKNCSYDKVNLVGGKNASLGELFHLSKNLNFNIANGFAITTEFYQEYINQNDLENFIIQKISNLNVEDLDELHKVSSIIKKKISNGKFTPEQIDIIKTNYELLSKKYMVNNLDVAVRSSAVAEDLPNASFAGQQDTFLNVIGIDNLLEKIREGFASLFNARAISYRKTHNIKFEQVKISIGVQKMVRSDIGSAGVAFSIDTESGYDKAIIINSSFGLGESVVSGSIKPDEIILDKRVLKDISGDPIIMKKTGSKLTKTVYDKKGTIEVNTSSFERKNISINNFHSVSLGRIILGLEEKYQEKLNSKCGVDCEWAIDGNDNKLYIIQVRPETVHSNNDSLILKKYVMLNYNLKSILSGVSVGEKISNGKICILENISEFKKFNKGDILVTDMTTPDWEPIMKISSGIITNKGGRTCHAAIVARELGVNALVGTENATNVLSGETEVTIDNSLGETGHIYSGIHEFEIEKLEIDSKLKLPVNLMFNVGNPDSSFNSSLIPNKGVGLARLEFIINNYIKIHPLALNDYPMVNPKLREKIYDMIGNHDDGKWFFIKRLARGMSKIASSFYPNDVIVRLSDFKSNEYKNLVGGEIYEPEEENPMIGWRGASRYYDDKYLKAFEMECKAIKYARDIMKMTNIVVMIPFCRTPKECEKVLKTMEKFGLIRGGNGLKVFLMCEIPSNVIEADNFSKYVDGVSIGGNDLLQLTLGVDRDSEKITKLSDHTNVSYRRMISMAIKTYKEHGVKVGFCGQQPSDSIEFAKFLIDEGIDSFSVVPESAIKTISKLGNL